MNFSNIDAEVEADMDSSIHGNGVGNMTSVAMKSDVGDVRILATSYLIYKIGRSNFPVVVNVAASK